MFKFIKKCIKKIGVALGLLDYKEETKVEKEVEVVKEVEKEVKLSSTGRFLLAISAMFCSLYTVLAFKLTYECFKIIAYTIISEVINCTLVLLQCLSAYLFVLGLALISLAFR